jgi:hypothetical protein
MSRDDPAEPKDTAQSLLQEVIDEWTQFDDVDAPVNGGDLVEWFGVFRERAKRIAWTGPASGRQTYIVTCYRVVRVPVEMDAENHAEAISLADRLASEKLESCMGGGEIKDTGETTAYDVDDVGETGTGTRFYDRDGFAAPGMSRATIR